MKKELYLCHICKITAVILIPQFTTICRVTSDCKPWPIGGNIGICTNCSTVQKLTNQFWREEAAKIYSNYNLYHQSTNDTEQPVFDQASGQQTPRSKKILDFVIKEAYLSTNGNMLDVGCGTGAMLQAFSNLLPNWELNGFEPNLKNPEKIFNIPGIKHIFNDTIDNISKTFDLISVIHALEHIEDPVNFLKKIRNKLNKNGVLLIEVPYFLHNPFDLLITDHCSHFTIPTISMLLAASGLKISSIRTDIIDKEITIIAKTSSSIEDNVKIDQNIISQAIKETEYSIKWIKDILANASVIAKNNNFGIFGTSIAANWLLGELKNSIKFFVEEDKNRIGKFYHQLPVYDPSSTPNESHVYIVLPRPLAEKVANRLYKQYSHFHLHLPPSSRKP